MKKVDFNISFKKRIEEGTYNVTWSGLPVRIICWDRKGVHTPDETPLNVLALVDYCGTYEKLLQATNDGTVYDVGYIKQTSKLQVTCQDLPGKLSRVKYCLAKADVFTDNLMTEFGYAYDNNKSHYYNRIGFINDFAKRYMNLFYRKLKLSGHWGYDDEEDWNLDFKEGDYVECICNDGPWILAVGDIYKIIFVEQSGRITIESIKDDRTLIIGESDFIDLFKHSDYTKPESEIPAKSNYHLWSIEDAKGGDIIFSNDGHGSDSIEIIRSISDKRIDFWFCLSSKNNFKNCDCEVFDGIIPYTNIISRKDAVLATKEQRDLLFQKMKESGYEWDTERKELKKINDKFDFSRMKVFTPVLARIGDNQTWFPHFFESYHPQNHGGEFYMIDCQHTYSQCVPFEGNEKLLRTQDPIPPFYDIR